MPATRRHTWQKQAVRTALAEVDEFVSAQQLHVHLRDNGTGVGLATVYRNLNEMVQGGEADSLHTATGEQLFRSCGPEHHHHLVCTNCSKTLEITAPLEDWVDSVAREHGFVQVRHVVDLFGLCPDCAAALEESGHDAGR